MNTRGLWFVGTSLLTLGGCILGYPLDQYEPTSETGGSGNSVTSTSSGGLGGAGSSSSAGGNGGGGGASACDPLVVCDARPVMGCDADCPIHTSSDRAGGLGDQVVRTLAIDSGGNFAIAGHYTQASFFLKEGINVTKLPDSVAGGGTMFTEGFVGYYDTAGDPVWAESIGTPMTDMDTGRSIFGAAFDSEDALILVGSETPTSMAKANLFIRKKSPTTTNQIPSDAWLAPNQIKRSIAGENLSSIAWAVATDALDFYVLGTSSGADTTIMCDAGSYTIGTGIFVSKFNAAGTCQWVRFFDTAVLNGNIVPSAIYAKNASSQGVWITGTTDKALPLKPLTADLNQEGDASTFGFAICLDGLKGEPKSGLKLTGKLKPSAISVVKSGPSIGDAVIVLSGGLTGPTTLNPSSVTAAFVSQLDVKAPTTANQMVASTFTHKTTLFVSKGGAANATGLVIRNNRIHVAGVFSETLQIPSMNVDSIDRLGLLVPFIATLSDDMTPLGVQAFSTESSSMAAEKNIAIAGNDNMLVLAGGWRTGMNMSTRHASMAGNLPLIAGNAMAVDLFVAQYSITP